MGTQTHTSMALAMFDNFPAFGRTMAAHRGFFVARNMFEGFDRAFAETEQRRSEFLSSMEVDPAQSGAQCYSYSSSTFRSGNDAPITHSSEQYRVNGGTSVSRARRSVGDQVVEETMKDGETTRTLQNLTEDELALFETKIAQHTARSPSMLQAPPSTPVDSTQAGLPAALQQDLDRLKQ